MKLLVFAHTPPPHHGQSYMVKLMIDGFGGDARRRVGDSAHDRRSSIDCYHVNCRYSEDLEDIGSFRFEKVWLVIRYCIEAIWCRFRYDVDAFYFVPAPGKRAALYRDWIVMFLCRPFFRHFIHHWHAVGLGDWLRQQGTWLERWITHRLLGRASLGIALAIPNIRDSLWFRAGRVEIVPNGIPDPCPDFEAVVRPKRLARIAARRARLAGAETPEEAGLLRVLYLAHCTASKGLFDTLEGVILANASLRADAVPMRLHLTVAGAFVTPYEEARFLQRLADPEVAEAVTYVGFVSGDAKSSLLRNSDVFCFPTYYETEGQPVNLIEAIAFGLAIVTTRWRAIPEIVPSDFGGFVAPHAPQEIAAALRASATVDACNLRAAFLSNFTEACHIQVMQSAIQSVHEPV